MGELSVADIVFVSFPFSDLSHAKLRPALVLAYAQRDDWILCQIASKSYNDDKAIRIDEVDYKNGGLNMVSFVRPGKLFTANIALINKNIAALTNASHKKVISAILQILKDGQ
ncbi:type II toxin-antitoxin system PemK/MazF family toxin [Methylobacter sp.]|uniref:type II toxin-antitoxin system PemK/MazF family toxin n=1 Tax=Methylobacter sp. TaxID=2051955 RepID=UPI002FDDA743